MPIDALYEAIRNAPQKNAPAQPQAASSFLQAAAAAHPTVQPEAPTPTAAPATPADLWNGYDYNAEAERRAQVGGYTPAPEAFRAPVPTNEYDPSRQAQIMAQAWQPQTGVDASYNNKAAYIPGTQIPYDTERGQQYLALEAQRDAARKAFEPFRTIPGANDAAANIVRDIDTRESALKEYLSDDEYRADVAAQKRAAETYQRQQTMSETEAGNQLAELYRQRDELQKLIGTTSSAFRDSQGQALNSARQEQLARINAQIRQYEADINAVAQSRTIGNYDALAGNADFAELSQYVPSEKREAAPLEKAFGLKDGYNTADIIYELVNGNADAWLEYQRDFQSVPLSGMFDDTNALKQIGDKERAIYNYLFHTDKEQAEKYLADLAPALNARARAEQTEWAQKLAREHPVQASLLTTALSPLKGLGLVMQGADYVNSGKIDENAAYNTLSRVSSTVRTQVSRDIERNYGKPGSFAYQTGMSVADNLYQMLLTGGAAGEGVMLAIMGSGAAADSILAAKQRGLSDGQALALGLASGAIEAITEKIGLDALYEGIRGGKTALRAILNSTLAEGSEEVLGTFLDDIADMIIAGTDSERLQRIAELKAQGMSDSEAAGRAYVELLKEAGVAGLSGALSGLLMSGGAQAIINGYRSAKEGIQTARDTREQNRVDEMVRMANEEAAQRYAGLPQNATHSLAAENAATAPFAPQTTNDTAQGENAIQGNTEGETARSENAVPSGTAIKGYQRRTVRGETLDEIRAHLSEIANDAPVASLTGNEFQKTDDGKSLRTKVIEFFDKIGNKVFRNGMGNIDLNDAGAHDSLAHGYGKLKAATFAALPDVLANGRLVNTKAPYEGHNYTSYYIAAPVSVGSGENAETVYVGALVIKDSNTQRYKLHEVLVTNGNGAPLFQSETGENAGPLRSDAPSGSLLGSPVFDGSIAPNANTVKSSPAAPATRSVGAAEAGYNYADMPHEENVSRQFYTTQTYSRPDTAEASGRTMEAYRKSLTYETRSIEEAQDRAAEALYYMQDGKEAFVGQIDPDGLNDVMNDLAEAKAWNDVQTAQAQMILAELRREAAKEQTAEKRAQFNQWLDVVQKHVREGARGMRMNREFSYSRDANRDGIITEQAAIERVNSNDKLSDAEKQALTDEIMEYDERITDTDDKAELIDIIMEIAEERKTVSHGATGIFARTIRSTLNTMSIETLKQAAYTSSAMLSEDAQKVDFWRKVKTIQVLNMLSNPKTTVTNVTSNLGMLLLDVQSMRLASLIDMTVSLRTKTRSIAAEKGLTALLSREGQEIVWQRLAESIAEVGLDINLGGGGKYFQGTQTFKADGRGALGTNKAADQFAERVLHAFERNMNYALRTPDELFKGLSRASSQIGLQRLQDEGRIRTENENYAEDTARDLELYRTFQNQRLISDVIVKLHDVLNLITPANAIRKMTHQELKQAAFGLGDIAAPFAKIAANLVGVAVDYNPVTAVKGLVQTIDILAKGENATAEQQRRAVSNLSRGLTGTALTIAAMFLARLGLIRRAGDEDDKSVASLNRTEGMTGTQINLSAAKRGIAGGSIDWQQGDMLIDLSRFEPINFLVDLGATLVANDATDADFITRVGQAAKSELESFGNASGDLPVLQSVGNFVEDVTSYGTPWYKALADTAGKTAVSSLTPNVIAALAKGIDPYQRNLYTRDNYDPKTDTLIDALMATLGMLGDTTMSRIPGLREMLPTKTDTTGNAAPNPGTLTQRLLNAMILPWGVNTYAQTETSKELERLREATGRTDFYPRVRNTTKSVQQDKVTYTFDYEERQEFQRLYSEAYWKDVNALVKTARYKNMDDAQKADALKSIGDDAYDTAKSVMIQRKRAS